MLTARINKQVIITLNYTVCWVIKHYFLLTSVAGDLLSNKIGNVKELIQYNRLKQDCVKNLWNENYQFEGNIQI